MLAAIGASAQGQTDSAEMRTVINRTVEDVIRPGYAGFQVNTNNLVKAAHALCSAPSADSLEAAQSTFRDTVTAWASVEFIRFGPVIDEYRLERILFWPDRKSTGLKQVQAALVGEDSTATNPATLKDKSVAMQGLGALEYVLFGTGADILAQKADYRCDYAKAIAANLDAMAGELVAGWAEDHEALGATDALNQLVATLVHGLEAIRDTRLRPFLGDEDTPVKPRLAIFWRSGMTLPLLHADIEGLAHFFDDSQMQRLLPEGQGSVADSIRFEIRQAAGLTEPDGRPIEETLADKSARDRLVLLDTIIASLIDRIDTQYAPAAGLSSGFSFSDGD